MSGMAVEYRIDGSDVLTDAEGRVAGRLQLLPGAITTAGREDNLRAWLDPRGVPPAQCSLSW